MKLLKSYSADTWAALSMPDSATKPLPPSSSASASVRPSERRW